MRNNSDDAHIKAMAAGNEMTSTLQEIESIYPEIYKVVYPEVVSQCNKLDNNHGRMYMPTLAELEPIANEIYSKMEAQLNKLPDTNEQEKLQYGYRRQGFFSSLIGLIFLGELFRRRRRFYPRYPYYRGPFRRRPFRPY